MSNNEDGVKMVRTAAAQIENLCPQVINAARVLAVRPRSKLALDNMDVFRDAWQAQVRLLTEAVDDITTIDDFLAVSGISLFLLTIYLNYILLFNFRKSYFGRCKQMCSCTSRRIS